MWMRLEGIEGMDGCCFGVLGDGALVACMDGDIAEDGFRDGASRTMLSCRGAWKGGGMGETERAVTEAVWAR